MPGNTHSTFLSHRGFLPGADQVPSSRGSEPLGVLPTGKIRYDVLHPVTFTAEPRKYDGRGRAVKRTIGTRARIPRVRAIVRVNLQKVADLEQWQI